MNKIKIAIIGAGVRGRYIYGDFIERNKDLYEIVAVVDNKIGRREKFKEIFNLSEERVFKDMNTFFKKEKMADVVIVATLDNTHYEACAKALEKGYDVLVEGLVSNTLDKLIHLQDLCEKNKDKIFMVNASYRYSGFFNKLKNIIDTKDLGKLVNINYNSYIGYEKFSHNYVRGNWRLDSDTAPLLLTNSCYDLDILEYLTSSQCEKISSFGKLNYFTRKEFKQDMSESCATCNRYKNCPYCAQEIYSNNKDLSKCLHINPTKENIDKILKTGQYGKCVYSCDNNVFDNLICILKFKNNITATLNISAFTKEENKNLRLMFTQGEVYADFQKYTIIIKKFIDNKETTINLQKDNMDEKLIEDFFSRVKARNNNVKSNVCSIINSHVTAFAGEFANISETVVDVDKFFEEAVEMTKSIEKLFL